MPNAWLTYAWTDDVVDDVGFIAQELERAGLTVRRDRWDIHAGRRLWQQIGVLIQDPAETDGWLLYATGHSLNSERCREELFYALDRALKSRGDQYPIVGIFPAALDPELIPPAIKSRLYVTLADANWRERVVAAFEGRAPRIPRAAIEPYHLQFHEHNGRIAIEVRPRAGVWAPFIVCIPANEREAVQPSIFHGPAGSVPNQSTMHNRRSGYGGAKKRVVVHSVQQ